MDGMPIGFVAPLIGIPLSKSLEVGDAPIKNLTVGGEIDCAISVSLR